VERRGEPRSLFFSTVTYTLLKDFTKTSSSIFKGVSVNISKGGFCLYVFHPIQVNEEIEILTPFLLLSSQKFATVRWVKKLTSDIYKIGLMWR
jgi:hypothetical protein